MITHLHESNGHTQLATPEKPAAKPLPAHQEFRAAFEALYDGLADGAPADVSHERANALYRVQLKNLVAAGKLNTEQANALLQQAEGELRPHELRPYDFRVRYLTEDMNKEPAGEDGSQIVYENGSWFRMNPNGWERMSRAEVLEHFECEGTILYFVRMIMEKLQRSFTSKQKTAPPATFYSPPPAPPMTSPTPTPLHHEDPRPRDRTETQGCPAR